MRLNKMATLPEYTDGCFELYDIVDSDGERKIRARDLRPVWFRDIAAVKCAGPDAPLAFPQYRDEYARRAAAMDAARCFANVEAMEALSESLARNVPQSAALAAAFANVATGGGGRAE